MLDALDAVQAALLRPYLEPVTLTAGTILAQTGEALPWVLFPCASTVIALVAVEHGTRTAEAASIGVEGLVDGDLTELPGFGRLQVQIPGPALRIEAATLDRLAQDRPALRAMLTLHTRALLVRTLQAAVCAALHPVEARASRWLLTTQDRTGQPDLPVTQEMLADMLGVRRTTVTRVIAQLSDRGLIRHRRSKVTVIDRMGLEQAACGCHAALLARLRHLAPAIYGQG
ncbi:Crp/Fnr family transcriptional regulator [Dankookia sp. P2]|uniref:Crp/Fnr family transcriptional regulator n=1 Tax=Dankookia sp. P2 TaxID=3423955 RepID=UPI003D66EF68